MKFCKKFPLCFCFHKELTAFTLIIIPITSPIIFSSSTPSFPQLLSGLLRTDCLVSNPGCSTEYVCDVDLVTEFRHASMKWRSMCKMGQVVQRLVMGIKWVHIRKRVAYNKTSIISSCCFYLHLHHHLYFSHRAQHISILLIAYIFKMIHGIMKEF